jgi:hypothetical protein
MVVKDKIKNRAYVAKSRQKLINSIGIDAYRKRNAEAQREYRKKLKALKNANIQDRKGRNINIDELKEVRREVRPRKSKN